MEWTERRDRRRAGRRRGVLTVMAAGVVVILALVVPAQFILLTGPQDGNSREGETLTAEVTALSSSGRSLCLERAGSDETCGVPVVLPDSKGQLAPVSTITVTELWLTTDGSTKLSWMVH